MLGMGWPFALLALVTQRRVSGLVGGEPAHAAATPRGPGLGRIPDAATAEQPPDGSEPRGADGAFGMVLAAGSLLGSDSSRS